MKQLGFFLCLFLLGNPNTSVAQDSDTKGSYTYKVSNTANNVEFLQAFTKCNGKTTVLLKFNNRNDHQVKVTWKELFVTEQVKQEAEGFRQKEIILPPGITSVLGCDDENYGDLIISADKVSRTYSADILEFKFADIRVVSVN